MIWILIGAGIAALALIPTYPYVRLIPLGIGALAALYGCALWVGRYQPAVGAAMVTALGAVLLAAVCIGVSTGGAIVLYGRRKPELGLPFVVVLGAKVDVDGASRTLQERIDRAAAYLKESPDTVAVVSGGQGSDEPVIEAECMLEGLVALGIGPERIWLEDRATSTWENMKFSLDIIEGRTGQRPERIGVVSSQNHLFRTSCYLRKWGIGMTAIPARTEEPLRWLHYFIREIAGVWHFLILGGRYQ